MNISFSLATRRYQSPLHDTIFKFLVRARLILHAIRGKPIIYGCNFKKGIELEGNGVLVACNKIESKGEINE